MTLKLWPSNLSEYWHKLFYEWNFTVKSKHVFWFQDEKQLESPMLSLTIANVNLKYYVKEATARYKGRRPQVISNVCEQVQ